MTNSWIIQRPISEDVSPALDKAEHFKRLIIIGRLLR